MTLLPFCEYIPGPSDKRGYGGVTTRGLGDIEGEVDHSMEGYYGGALAELLRPDRKASWHFSLRKEGRPVQHYHLEDICWHAGGPGDRSFDTSLIGNLTLIGKEHEDYPTNQLNENQIYWSAEITRAIRSLCPRVAANPPTLRVNMWEHNWLSQTSCPSGLIPWQTLFAVIEQLEGEDFLSALTDLEQREILARIRNVDLGDDQTHRMLQNVTNIVTAIPATVQAAIVSYGVGSDDAVKIATLCGQKVEKILRDAGVIE